jgi:nucleoside-diphosphate-sugar epimerase
VAGSTGAVGRRLLPMLREAGQEVTGSTRNEASASLIRDLGAEPVIVDMFDPAAVMQAVADARPEVVIHQLTSIPRAMNPKHIVEAFETNNRLRREGTRNLMEAAKAAGARRFVAQSFGQAYAPAGPGLRVETDPLNVEQGDIVRAIADLEQIVTQTEGIEGLALRYGFFYGPGSSYAADGAQAEALRKRRFPIVGKGDGMHSFIHVDDAAAAAVRAMDQGSPGIYNVADDEPARVADWLPALAEAVGAPPPRRVPVFLAKWFGGEYGVYFMTRGQGISNEKAKRELALGLRYPSWRQGFREALG